MHWNEEKTVGFRNEVEVNIVPKDFFQKANVSRERGDVFQWKGGEKKGVALAKIRSLSDNTEVEHHKHKQAEEHDDKKQKLSKRHTFGGEQKKPFGLEKLYPKRPHREGNTITDETLVKNRLPDFAETQKPLLPISTKLNKRLSNLYYETAPRWSRRRQHPHHQEIDSPKRTISLCINSLDSQNKYGVQNTTRKGTSAWQINSTLNKTPRKVSFQTNGPDTAWKERQRSISCSTISSVRADGKRESIAMQYGRMDAFGMSSDEVAEWGSSSESESEDSKELALLKRRRPIDRFRKIVRLLCFLLKVKSSTDRKYSQPQHTVVFEQLQELAEAGGDDDGMAFDPKYFKAIREVQLSQDAVHILSLAPGTRTDDQIQAALAALKASVAAFGEYPLKMQKRLVTVGWFERFEAKRVIIRQGHRAENFYFILSGTALVTLLIADSSTGEQRSNTVAVLGKGSSFGELALLHHKTRSATVLCKDEVALLAVGREDFRDIFMSYEDGKEPDHIKFLRTVPYLKDIPLDQCARRHDLCLFHYFRRGVVIVKNSNTEWIYIMKTGSCRVLTNLEKKKASLSPTLVNDAERLFNLPAIPVDETERRRVLYTASGERSRVTWSPLKKRPRTEPGTTKRDDLSLPAIAEESNKFKKTVKKVNFALPWIDRLNEKDVKEQMEAHRERIETLHRKLTHENLMRQNSMNAKTDKNNNNTKTEHVCVQIEVLKPKDQFGLSEILHDNKAVKCHLVSNGAECILIKKSWFLQNAGESILRLLRGQISPYPTQQTLEQNLLDQANWESFKSQTINDLLDTLHL